MSTSLAVTSLGSSKDFEVYADAAAASGVNFATLHGKGGPRAVLMAVDATLTVTKYDGDSETVTAHSSFVPIGSFSAITGGTATAFTVLW